MKHPFAAVALALLGSFAAFAGVPARKVTPVMGWSSWNSFGREVDRAKVVAQMDALVKLGLRDYGWNFINIDDCYQNGRDPKTGRLRINEQKFPGGYRGMRELVDYAHSLGLKAGIYSDGGDNCCASDDGKNAFGLDVGFWRHERDDANMFMGEGIWRDAYAQAHPEDPGIECWGFDFIKIDWCGGGHAKLNDRDQYNKIMDEIDAVEAKTGKQKIVNICRWAYRGPWQFRADSWRTGGDIEMHGQSWESMTVQIDILKDIWQYTRPGSMNDPDMLVAGLNLTPDEDKSHFAMWCMFSAPMLIGQDLTKIRPETLALYKNAELIALNQDPAVLSAGYLGDLVPGVEIWVKFLGSDRSDIRAVALLNRSTKRQEVAFDYALAGYTGKVKARDLFAHADLPVDTVRKVTIPPHGIDVLKLAPADEEPVVGPKFAATRNTAVASASLEETRRIDWVNAFAAVRDGAVLLDVRTPEEYAAGHVDGAINLPHTRIASDIAGVVPDKAKPIVCHCRTYKRAAQALRTLDFLGYKNVRFVGDGYAAAKDAPKATLKDVKVSLAEVKGQDPCRSWVNPWYAPWPSAMGKPDTSWSEKPISIAGKIYAKGFGTKATFCGGGSLVECIVPKGATHFLAMVGVDDCTEVDAPVTFAVHADDVRVAETRPMLRGEQWLFAVPVKDVKKLKLFTTGEKPVYASWGGAGFAMAVSGATAEWISVPDAPVATEADRKAEIAAPGTSWFCRDITIAKAVKRAAWRVSGLGVFEIYVNGAVVGDDFLKPGFTHPRKTKYSFIYDVTKLLKDGANTLVAEVSSGWWRDRAAGYPGKKSAFWGELEIEYADGTKETVATDARSWKGAVAGPVVRAGIFDGEIYDARTPKPVKGDANWKAVEKNEEFKGELRPSVGAEIVLRRDLAMKQGPFTIKKGETKVVDFGQNCAGVPEFVFSAKAGTVLTCLPGEMLNDADKGQRGSDGPKGSVYRANLRAANSCMRLEYTFAGKGEERYLPRFTFFGYRYVSITATDDVEIKSVASIPVTSIKADQELGSIETGDKDVNRLIKNVYWGQLSNYLSVPTDCPQRNERQGWMADTQVFTEAGSFNADTYDFFRKFLQDVRDTQHGDGAYSSVAPWGAYGDCGDMRLGWTDAGIIVPYVIWRQFGQTGILEEHWNSMVSFMSALSKNPYSKGGAAQFQFADWLSYENYECTSGKAWLNGKWNGGLRPETSLYWKYLGGCYWLMDSRMMAEMAAGLGKRDDAAKYAKMADEAREYIRKEILEDGCIPKCLKDMQTPALFALHLGVLDADEAARTKAALLANIKAHGDCLQTGFLGTSIIMDTLTEIGAADVAYTLLLQHKNPSWLYSVDQGATTIWERWNSYTKKDGFGDVGMNSFNHYAYGAVLAWIYKTAAGIASDPKAPGYANIVMAPIPDKRLGSVKASYKTPHGVVRSEWHYEGDEWVWNFTIPETSTADVTVPGKPAKRYSAGTYCVRK